MLPALEDVRSFRSAVQSGIPEPLAASAELETLFAELDRAERCFAEMEGKRLAVALFGGTGVGKSTLLNALAGAPISEAGDRRPTTDRVVCYRHRDFPVPAWLPAEDLADPPPPPHQISRLKGVLLLDLPDIDSRALEHSKIVHRLLPHLDVLVVVTSVDKYGDRALYCEVSALPQAPRNLAFVLNATDRLAADDIARVQKDFLTKLERFSPLRSPEIFALSAREALASPGARSAGRFEDLAAYLDALGSDHERQAALAANAEASLERVAEIWGAAVPSAGVREWLDALGQIPRELPVPGAAVVAALQDHLAEVVGTWAADRALRASWFPIGPLHFLARRLRPSRSARQASSPLDAGDPCRSFTEQLLARPLRLAAHEATRALRPLEGKLALTLPEARAPDPQRLRRRVAPWRERLGRRSDRWAWRIRQHILPGLFAFCWLGWIAAEGTRGGDGWWQAVSGALWTALSSLSPLTLAITAGSLLVYYLLVYPYYLYRLERNVRREAVRGADLYLKSWREAFDEVWGRPFQERVRAAADWWQQAEARFAKLRG
jgi:energy-coupling factor transporter ATP-binding protein EcfA2